MSDKADLPEGYVPTEHDVLCGKGKSCYNWIGTRRFRVIVDLHLDRYATARSKLEKSSIVSAIVNSIRQNSPQGGFIKQDKDSGRWYEVGDVLAREKVGQTIRDALHFQYRSSTKSKKKRRQAEQAKAHANMKRITNTYDLISKKVQDLQAKVTTEESEVNLSTLFTQANLDILNELNRLSHDETRLQQLQTSTGIKPPMLVVQEVSQGGAQYESESSESLANDDRKPSPRPKSDDA